MKHGVGMYVVDAPIGAMCRWNRKLLVFNRCLEFLCSCRNYCCKNIYCIAIVECICRNKCTVEGDTGTVHYWLYLITVMLL